MKNSYEIIKVYEQLLAQNPAYRKEIGAFYTPAFIVNYMVEQCFKAFAEKPYLEFCQIRLIDPACGGGAFLVGAYQYLLDYHSQKRNKVLTLAERKEILFNQIFGVDIDEQALQVCKQALLMVCYESESPEELDVSVLDQNIKCGDSLVSRFPIEQSIQHILNHASKWNVEAYKAAVATYRNAQNKEQKREMERLIADIKADFRTKIAKNDPKLVRKRKLEGELFNLMYQTTAFESQTEKQEKAQKAEEIQKEIDKLTTEIQEIENNKIFENAFEWRFEFPEVLDDNGNFVGFDIVIGNPPYIDYRDIDRRQIEYLRKFKTSEDSRRPNLYQFFIEIGYNIMANKGYCCYINPNHFLSIDAGYGIRRFIVENTIIQFIDDVSNIKVFDEASTYTVVWSFKKEKNGNYFIRISKCKSPDDIGKETLLVRKNDIIANGKYLIIANVNQVVIAKIEVDKPKLGTLCNMIWGTSQSGYGKKKILVQQYNLLSDSEKQRYAPIIQTRDIKRYFIDWKQEFIPRDIFSDNVIVKFQVDEKIVIARMTLQLQAAIDQQQYFVGKSTVVFNIDSKIDKFFLLGILNSKVVNFWYKNYFENTHLSGGYIRFDIPYLKQIPIVVPDKENQNEIAILVGEILSIKSRNPTADTTALENQIDCLVYELYGLTEEEIKIVEQNGNIYQKYDYY